MSDYSQLLAAKLEPLRPLVERRATVDFKPDSLFVCCLMSSFVKTFEFVELTTRQDPNSALFLTSALRSTTEEIIVLRFLSPFTHEDRMLVLRNLMNLDVYKKVEQQHIFFRTFRPFQPVLNIPDWDEQSSKDSLRDFWRDNGWPKFKGEIPNIRELAQRSDSGLLEVVYDFIYRLTSSAVHFGPQELLRLGWSKSPPQDGVMEAITFSPQNMGSYYLTSSQVYGAYLLCLYFELFGEHIQPNEQERAAVASLREHLLWILRWPEMVTSEELNLNLTSPPEISDDLVSEMYTTIVNEGFLSSARYMLDHRQASQSRSTKEETP